VVNDKHLEVVCEFFDSRFVIVCADCATLELYRMYLKCLHTLKELVPHPKTRQKFVTSRARKQFSRYSPQDLRTSVFVF